MLNRRILVALPLLLLAVLAVWGVGPRADEGVRVEPLVIETAGGPVAFAVEVADTPALREKGLMFREHLSDSEGMLFDFHESRAVGFWMRNTPLSLDLVFIRRDGTVAGIHGRAVPFDETIIESPGPVRAVLEIRGGRAEVAGIREGDRVRHAIFE